MGKLSRSNKNRNKGGGHKSGNESDSNRRSSVAVAKDEASESSDNKAGTSPVADGINSAGDAAAAVGGSVPVTTNKFCMQPHRHAGVYMVRGHNESIQLLTMMPKGPLVSLYREQIYIVKDHGKQEEYRSWSPFKSKLAAALLCGIDNLYMGPGDKVLCLRAANGCTPSHVSDIVGTAGVVYAVEHAGWTNRRLLSLGSKRPNIVPIIEDTTWPYKYRDRMGSCIDTIYCDIGHTDADQTRTLLLNARHFLKTGGHFLLVLRVASSVGSEGGMSNELNIDKEKAQLKAEEMKVLKQINLDPFAQGHVLLVGVRLQCNTPPTNPIENTNTGKS